MVCKTIEKIEKRLPNKGIFIHSYLVMKAVRKLAIYDPAYSCNHPTASPHVNLIYSTILYNIIFKSINSMKSQYIYLRIYLGEK